MGTTAEEQLAGMSDDDMEALLPDTPELAAELAASLCDVSAACCQAGEALALFEMDLDGGTEEAERRAAVAALEAARDELHEVCKRVSKWAYYIDEGWGGIIPLQGAMLADAQRAIGMADRFFRSHGVRAFPEAVRAGLKLLVAQEPARVAELLEAANADQSRERMAALERERRAAEEEDESNTAGDDDPVAEPVAVKE